MGPLATLYELGEGLVLLDKVAAPTAHALAGRLYASQSGWLLLHVPNALGVGAFEALDATGAKLPEGHAGGPYNAHISVIRPEELEAKGLKPEDIKERGKSFAYTLGEVKVVKPGGWDEMEQCWFIDVDSPELEELRTSYGLSRRPNGSRYRFHITFAVQPASKQSAAQPPTANIVHEPEKWLSQSRKRPLQRRPLVQGSGGRFVAHTSTKPATLSKDAAFSPTTQKVLGGAALLALLGAGVSAMSPRRPEMEDTMPVDDRPTDDPAAARLNNTLRWSKKPQRDAFDWLWPTKTKTPSTATFKTAALLAGVNLQPHQQSIALQSAAGPTRKLLYHSLGSGKSLSAISSAEAAGDPYTAVVPAALRDNFRKEQAKFTDGSTPSQVVSYNSLARSGAAPVAADTVIFDEAHRLRDAGSQQTQQATDLAANAKRLFLLTGTPIVNRPSDLASPISMLTGTPMSTAQFDNDFVQRTQVSPGWLGWLRGIKPGDRMEIKNRDKLKKLLAGKVDYHAPPDSGVKVDEEEHSVEMSPEQRTLYQSFWGELPTWARWKMEKQFPLSMQEQRNLASFMSGPRQVGLSTLPFMKDKADPELAFKHSPKLQQAMSLLEQRLVDPSAKAVVYSNFVRAGLDPYSAALKAKGIPHGMFFGGMTDAERKKTIADYNEGRTRALLVGPAGAEGLSLKGTRLMQILDPHWNETKIDQAIGRGLRYDSHTHLPEDQRQLTIQRFASNLPPNTLGRLAAAITGGKAKPRNAADVSLRTMADRKEALNDRFLDLLKEVGTEGKPKQQPTVLSQLQEAKKLSDSKRYDEKHKIVRSLMQTSPADWTIDAPEGRHVGVTHRPTGFKLHMDRTKIPEGVQ